MQLLLWSCRWGFGLVERTTDAAPSHWHQLVYRSLCSDLLRAQTVGQPAKWQALSVKIGVMRSCQTRWFKIFHVYVFMVNMCKYSCVCLQVCLQIHMCEYECGDQKLRSSVVLHIMWVACILGVCVLGGLGCVHVYIHACEGQKFRMSFFPDCLLFYFWVRVSCQSLPILPFPYSQLGPGNTSLCLMTFEITSDCHTCLDFMWLLDTWTLDRICMPSTLTLKIAPW